MTPRPAGIAALLVGGLAAAGLAAGGSARPEVAAAGYVAALAAWSALPIGAVALLMGFRLAGGAWSAVPERALGDLARTLPPTLLLFLPMPFLLPLVYPWAQPGWAAAHETQALYLNEPFFLLRLAGFLLAWVALGRWLARSAAALPAIAGILVFLPTASLAGVDWLLSRDPGFRSSQFGLMFVAHQLVAAYAFALLIAPLRSVPRAECGVLGGLLLACVIGWGYFAYMPYLVVWMADLPHEASWYLARREHGWGWAWLAVAVPGGVVPFLALLVGDLRSRAGVLKGLAAGILLARLIESAWLALPAERIDLAAAALMTAAVLAVGGLWTGAWLLTRRA